MEIKDNPQVYIEHIDSFGKNLTDWEKGFIANMIDSPPVRFSQKQIDIITCIYDEKC